MEGSGGGGFVVATSHLALSRAMDVVAATTRAQFARCGSRKILHTPKRRGRTARAAAEGAAGDENPYQVLGVAPGADSDAVRKAYNRALRDARAQGDDATIARIEYAHDRIVMSALSARLSGSGPQNVSKEVLYADKQEMFPWKPRKSQCQNRDIAINAAIAVFASSWSLSSPMAGFQPMLAAMVVYFFRFRQKLDAVFPSPTADKEEASRQNNKKMIRSFGLAIGSVALGAFIMQTLPFLLREYLNVRLPFWFIYKQQVFTNVVSSWTMFVMSSFYR